jgi:hypothetical protein
LLGPFLGMQMGCDKLINTFRGGWSSWTRRVGVVRRTVGEQPLAQWPRLLLQLRHRGSARRKR